MKQLLIVDDDQSLCETVAAAMGRRGFVVTWRTSAVAALEVLDAQDFDVVMTDLHMDGMDGLAFCERALARRPDVPVVVLTAFGNRESALAAIRAGAYDFMIKPFDVEMLRMSLARAVQHHALLEEVKRLRGELRAAQGSEEN